METKLLDLPAGTQIAWDDEGYVFHLPDGSTKRITFYSSGLGLEVMLLSFGNNGEVAIDTKPIPACNP